MSESGKPEALSQFYDQLEAATQDPTAPKFNAALNTGANWLLAQTSQEHWFCSKDSSDEAYFRDLYEVATFCLRLCEFKMKNFVLDWKRGLDRCLLSCCHCVTGYVKAKHILVDKYLKLTATEQNRNHERFLKVLITKEAALLQSALEDKTRPFPAPYLQLVLLQTPHIVSEVLLPLLRDVKLPHLPEDLTPPPGLFIWAISNVDKLRAFSLDQIHHLQSCMLEDLQEQYIPNHSALAFVLKQLGLRSRSTQAEEFESGQYMISQQPDVLWRSLQRIVTRLDSRIILRATFDAVRPVEDIGVRCAELVRLVCSHLGDTGSHWAAVLHTFAALLDKCQSHLWGGEDPAYSGIVMHAILDNPQLEISMQSKKDVFGWAIPFIDSVKETPLLQPHLSAILNILCVRLQLPRFEVEFRVAGARAGVRLLLKVFVSGLNHSPLSSRLQNIKADILEVHMPFLSRISFTQPYACLLSSSRTLSPTEQNDRLEEHRAWIKVSTEARRLVGHLLKQDNRAIASYQLELADYLFTNNVEADVPQLKICQTAWKNCYRDISTSKQNQSVNFAGIMLLAFAPVAHLERPLDKVWLSDAITGSKLKPVIRRLQAHFDSAIEPLSDLLSDVADASPSKSNFIAQDHVCQDIVAALLSPSEVVHNSALTVIREAYDGTDTREHCFRALLLNHPVSTITGLQKTCESFTFAGAALPDACGEAMRLARCLSSVLDALCDPEDGLLRDESWLDQDGVRTALPQLWETLCETSARIYEKTPEWSAHHENDRMTVWMRDAIIFGRSLADQIRAFEAASTGASVGESPQKVSNIGAQLVKKMNRTVEALSSWLRLTDAELLRSTCDLLVKFVERLSRFQVALSFKTLRRIKKYATASSSHDSDRREAFKIIIVLQSHPCHREDFEGLAAPLEPEPQPKRMPNRPLTIEIDDDDEEDKEVEFLGKQQAKLQINQQQRSASTSSIPSNSMSQPKASTSKSSERSGKRPTATVSGALARQAAKGPLKAKKDSQSLLVKPPKLKREAPPPPRQTFSHAALRKMQNSRLAGDSSSAEEDELPKGLASLANPNKRPRVEVPEKRQVISIPKPNEDLASIKDERSAKALAASEAKRAENAARLRAAPDFSGLHRTLLQWDLGHTGQAPPHTSRPTSELHSKTFVSAQSYTSHFEPLFMLECWQQICQARDALAVSTESQITTLISGRQSVDDFTEVFLKTQSSNLPDRFYLNDADLVILKHASSGQRLMAKVQEYKRKGETTTITLRVYLSHIMHNLNSLLVPRSQWQLSRLVSLSTLHREYAALKSLPYLHLCPDIIGARLPLAQNIDTVARDKIMRIYRTNEPQATAILQASQAKGFSLIQGPPGTGKSSTVVNLVGALCSHRGAVPSRGSQRVPARLLLCAPSNAAVDELVRRLKDGVRSMDGEAFSPHVVRIGADSSISSSVRDVFIDELVDKQLNTTSADDGVTQEISNLRNELDSIKVARLDKQKELDALTSAARPDSERINKLESAQRALRRQNQETSIKLQEARDSMQARTRALDASKRNARMDILSSADVICTTLSGSGHDYMSSLPDFNTVIIDEAAQSVELSCLIPLRYGCQQCIMVGDPQQLPPTVLSRVATNCGYDCSMFQRLQDSNPQAVHLLSIQYRMHPSISRFPSNAFYGGKITDGPDMAIKTAAPWHADSRFPTFAFLHVLGGQEQKDSLHSVFNREEASTALALYGAIRSYTQSGDLVPSIGVVSTYAAQLKELKKQFRGRFGASILNLVDFNTVDGFQGQEKDIIILSCVRGGPQDAGIGFLSDERRMNVALTRARSSIFILGNSHALRSNNRWASLIDHAKAHAVFRDESIESVFPVTAQSFQSGTPVTSMPTKVAATRPEQRATWKKSLKGAEDPVGAKDLVRPQSLASSRSNPSQKPTHDMQPLPGVVKVQQGASKRPRLSEDTTTIVDAQQNDKRLRVEVPPEETRAGASKEPSPVSPAVSTPDSAAGGSFPSNTNATSAAGLVKRPPPPPRPAASSLFVPKKRVSLPRIMACLTLSSSDVPAVMAG